MEIKERRDGNVVILDLEGKILLGEGDTQLKECIAALVARGERRILLNMENVPYMDSSGLGEIVRCFAAVKRASGGGELKLTNLSKRLVDLLTITKLISVFETYEDESLALKSFSPIKIDDEIGSD